MTAAIGIGIFLGMLGIGAAAIHWAKTLMRDHEMVEERHPIRSSDDTREAAVQILKDGVEDSGAGIGRRGLLKGTMLTALAVAPLSVARPDDRQPRRRLPRRQAQAHDVEEGDAPHDATPTARPSRRRT